MKKLLIIFLVITGWIIWRYSATSESLPPVSNMPVPTVITPVESGHNFGETIEIDGEIYKYQFTEAVETNRLKLVDNYSQQLNSEKLMEVNNCLFGINGGFYDTDNKPLGWVVVDGVEISRSRESQLFNGYVGITETALTIGRTKPETDVIYGLQTGPLLIANSQTLTLDMATDKNARRMVMGTDENGKTVFLVFYSETVVTSGPLLAGLPTLVQMAAKQEGLKITHAVNLDGGSASAFYNGGSTLSESNPVGSWWCVK